MGLTKDEVIKHASIFNANQIVETWNKSDLSHIQLRCTDKNYRALPESLWAEILQTHFTLHKYSADYFDCDSFSSVFMGDVLWNYEVNGLAKVLDYSAKHSYNAVLVSDDGKSCYWRIVEPQIDGFVDDKTGTKIVVSNPEMYSATEGEAYTA